MEASVTKEQIHRDAEREHEKADKFFDKSNEYTVNSGNIAIRTILLINGAAAITLLAFIGNLISNSSINFSPQFVGLTNSLMWFVVGVAFTAFGMGVAYIANYLMTTAQSKVERNFVHPYTHITKTVKNCQIWAYSPQIITIAVTMAALIFFIIGMFEVKDAIATLAPIS